MTAPVPPRGRPRDERVDQLVLQAAYQELVAVGPERFSMRSVARRAGVARASLQLRWVDTDSLMVEALKVATGDLELKDTGNFSSDLRFAVQAVADHMVSPGLQLMVRVIADGELRAGPLHQLQQRILEPNRVAMKDMFERAAKRGELRRGVGIDWLAEIIIGSIYMRTVEHPELKPPGPGDLHKLAKLVSSLASAK
jgi:AcrR family transcriptional regulator